MIDHATTLEQFQKLFQGSATYYGESKSTNKKRADGKTEFRSWINARPASIQDWKDHINGSRHIGMVPIRDNSTCSWGVIDVDKYNLNHLELIKIIRERKYPLVPYRSKSNGLHLILHISEPVDASIMRSKLIEIASDLGVRDETTDIFPAQDEVDLTPENWDDKRKGNFVNLPYQHAARTTRMALYDNGMGVPLTDLYSFVSKFIISPAQLKSLSPDKNIDPILKDYPPCVAKFIKNKVREGHGRNDALFNCAVLCKKINPDEDEWPELFREFNKSIGVPPLLPKELNILINQHKKTDYNYRCNTSIAKSHCEQSKCLTKKYGINKNESMPEVGRLIKYNVYPEPYWVIPVNGTNIKLDNKELYSQRLWAEKLQTADIVWRTLKASKNNPDPWSDFKDELIKNKMDMEGYDALADKEDLFNSRMVQFYEDSEVHEEFDQIDNGYIWIDTGNPNEAKEMRFKVQTFQKFMKKMGSNWSFRECTNFLQTGGGEPKKKYANIQTRHWVCKMPKIPEYKTKDVKNDVKIPAPWSDN
tara:strand:- start:15398 stop:16996 length:1599 start_codon:yes stop_codon:yes gene_type:complete